jgi:Ca2+-binding RTX toxin-like protein
MRGVFGRRRGIAVSLALLTATFVAQATAASDSAPETPRCHGRIATIIGTAGDDALRGTPHRDVIWGGPGNDVIYGGLGSDLICGGSGDDLIHGGRGNDVLNGGTGSPSTTKERTTARTPARASV